MIPFLETCFSTPVLPATALLLLVMCYWLIVIVGATGLDLFDFDLDIDGHSDVESVLSFGLIGLRFVNLGRVPFMVWLTLLALSWWAVSIFWTPEFPDESWQTTTLLIVRHLAVGLVITKLLTQPLVGLFESEEPLRPEQIVGSHGVVTTSVINTNFGQIKVETEGSPLLLNAIALDGKKLLKGDLAEVVDFDAERNLYLVAKADSGV